MKSSSDDTAVRLHCSQMPSQPARQSCRKATPDAAELVRAKTGRITGSPLMALSTVMKGLATGPFQGHAEE